MPETELRQAHERPPQEATVLVLDGELRALVGSGTTGVRRQTLQELFGAAAARHLEPLVGAALRGEAGTTEVDGADGRVLRVSATPIDGDGPRCVVVAHDATHERRLEQRLRATHRLETFGLMARRMAHDFNNVLMGIMGCADLAQRFITQDSRAHPFLDELKQAALQGASLTRQLLGFSRRSEAPPSFLHVDSVISESEILLQSVMSERVRLELSLGEGAWAVRMDPAQLQLLLLNLVLNAADALPTGGAVRVATDEVTLPGREPAPAGLAPGDYCVITVADDGVGMEPGALARASEPFFTTQAARTGLGLTVVVEAAAGAGGGVTATSTPGAGTRVSLYLPRARPERAPAAPVAAPPATVLVVDDESLVRLTVRGLLEPLGHRVLEAAGRADAALASEPGSERVDVLLTDVSLGGATGREIVALVAARHPQARVVFMSAHQRETLVETGEIGAAATFLEKPFDEASLALALATALA